MIDCTVRYVSHIKHSEPVYTPMHTHKYYELVYFVRGSGVTTVTDSTFSYHNNCFALYAPGCVHDENNFEPVEILLTLFLHQIPDITLAEGVFSDPSGKLLALQKKLRQLSLQSDPCKALLMESCLSEIIATIVHLQSALAADTSDEPDWQSISDYIDEFSHTDIDFSALAKLHHYSYDRFRHLFCRKFSVPPYTYLLQRRIENAKYMLIHTTRGLTEIAYDCGFTSSSQFSNTFKKHIGLPPRTYRKTNR